MEEAKFRLKIMELVLNTIECDLEDAINAATIIEDWVKEGTYVHNKEQTSYA